MNADQVLAHLKRMESAARQMESTSSSKEISGAIEGADQFIANVSENKNVFGENTTLSDFYLAIRNGHKSAIYVVSLTKKGVTNTLKIFHMQNTIFLSVSGSGRRVELEFVPLDNGAYQCIMETPLCRDLATNWEGLTALLSSVMIYMIV